jgi:hypothetical protein
MAGIGRALEGAAPVSRLHQLQSFDPADFPVPTGREEDWRFTPLRRMRGLQAIRCGPSARSPWKPIPHPRSLPPGPKRGIAGLV